MKHYKHLDMGKFSIQVPRSHWVEDGNGGGRRVQDEPELVTVRLLIDVLAIAHQLGPRAARSKSGKSKFMAGAVIVSRIS